MWSYVSPEARVPQDHPLRPMRQMVDVVLTELSPRFAPLYATTGRPSIAPEKLLRALLLQVLYTVRSERLLMEQLDYNLLFRWFGGLEMDDPVWDHSVFTKNRERVLAQARQAHLLSNEHFTADGTLFEAWAGHKSFKNKTGTGGPPPDDPGNPTVNFRGEARSNATHTSTTDPDARSAKKTRRHESKLAYQGHVLIKNRSGLVVANCVSRASGIGERRRAADGERAAATAAGHAGRRSRL